MGVELITVLDGLDEEGITKRVSFGSGDYEASVMEFLCRFDKVY